jgi:predicted SnoaL-like aldol condensation-catalyzing enzyme
MHQGTVPAGTNLASKDGVGAFLHDVEQLMQHRTTDELKFLLGQGDFVFIAAKGTHEGEPSVYVDLHRFEDEKIVEHWGFPQKAPPQTELKNHNGMHRGSEPQSGGFVSQRGHECPPEDN